MFRIQLLNNFINNLLYICKVFMSNLVEESIVRDVKKIIERGSIDEMQEFWLSITREYEFDQPIDFPWIIQKIFIHSCLQNG